LLLKIELFSKQLFANCEVQWIYLADIRLLFMWLDCGYKNLSPEQTHIILYLIDNHCWNGQTFAEQIIRPLFPIVTAEQVTCLLNYEVFPPFYVTPLAYSWKI
jgi:hypothetical protein